jgi:hypothetical protein
MSLTSIASVARHEARRHGFPAGLPVDLPPPEREVAIDEAAAPAQTVFGHYNRNNAGSEAYRPVFDSLFAGRNVEFVNSLKRASRTDQIVLGAGAVLNEHFLGQLKDVGRIYAIGCALPNGRANLSAIIPLRDRIKCLYVNNSDDRATLQEAGIAAVQTPDLLFALQPPRIDFTPADFAPYTHLPPVNITTKPHTVFVFLSEGDKVVYDADRLPQFLRAEQLKTELAHAFDALSERCNIVFVPLSVWYNARDYIYALDVVRRMRHRQRVYVVDSYIEPMVLLGAMASMSASVVSTKFHGLVFGLLTGKLVINVSDLKRNRALMRDAGLDGFSLPLSKAAAPRIVKTIAKHTEPRVRARIEAIQHKWHEAARAHLADLRAIVPA